MSTLSTISKDSRLDLTVGAVNALIASGQIAFGDLLPAESELCRQIGVSRSTLREAIRVLQSRGLVSVQHGIGIRVADRTSQVAADSILRMLKKKGFGSHDMLEVRLMLECQAAALAAERATEADIANISATIDEMAAQPKSVQENVKLDFDFHVRVAEASHNLVLVILVDAIRDLLYETIWATHSVDSRIAARVSFHSAVLRAIQQRDATAAHRTMKAHIEESKHAAWLTDGAQLYGQGGDARANRNG